MSNHTATETALPSSGGLAAFLLRVAAYFQGYLAAFPRLAPMSCDGRDDAEFRALAAQGSLTLIDEALDGSSGPLMRVRMNRALTRRMCWLVRRGRMKHPSGQYRLCRAQDEARCNLTPGQMAEYCIRNYGISRVAAYGLGLPHGTTDQGSVVSWGCAPLCPAILTPD